MRVAAGILPLPRKGTALNIHAACKLLTYLTASRPAVLGVP
jgi:hypothetical protein